jgi:hypothetical protein
VADAVGVGEAGADTVGVGLAVADIVGADVPLGVAACVPVLDALAPRLRDAVGESDGEVLKLADDVVVSDGVCVEEGVNDAVGVGEDV